MMPLSAEIGHKGINARFGGGIQTGKVAPGGKVELFLHGRNQLNFLIVLGKNT